uniref:Fibronectin type-III domain-containing protein n=1 Tax=Sphenodon punctatus TaxID=8508 RepID=A0A8D0GFQ0_SPHPU
MKPLLPVSCLLLLLWLSKIKGVAACSQDCSSINVTVTTTTITIFSVNFTISNVTYADDQRWANHSLEKTTISKLEPGVKYTVTLSFNNGTCCKNITTKPSPVFDIQIENINTTAVSLRWKINDTVASEYTYRIRVEGNGTSSEVTTTTNATNTVIAGLEPGTLYNFTLYSQVADDKTEGDPFSRS